jgi:AcrR family transcriptional regulator
MALYRHFDSKDELIIEYLNYKGKKSDEIWAEIEAESPGDPIRDALRIGMRRGCWVTPRWFGGSVACDTVGEAV